MLEAGRNYLRSGEFDRAIARFTEAITLNPTDKLSGTYVKRCEYLKALRGCLGRRLGHEVEMNAKADAIITPMHATHPNDPLVLDLAAVAPVGTDRWAVRECRPSFIW